MVVTVVAAAGTPPAVPGCAISGSATTDSSGNYTVSGLCVPATYTLTLNSNNKFIDTPDLYCDGALSATLTGQSEAANRDYGLTRIYDGWIQVEDGDVYAAGALTNQIPPSQACSGSCSPIFNLDGTGGDPGVVHYGTTVDLGDGTVSSKGWLARSGYTGKTYGFEFWRTQLDMSAAATADWTSNELLDANKPSGKTVYYANGDMNISNSTWQVADGEIVVVLVRGNLTIDDRIDVAKGGFLMFVTTGNIAINPTVNSEDGVSAVEGVYIADGSVSDGGGDKKLMMEGTFVGWQGMSLTRDFKTVRNNSEPIEVVNYRPDFLISAPAALKRPPLVWEEVAP